MKNWHEWHDHYENELTDGEKLVVNDAFSFVADTLSKNGINPAYDDRAEKLIAAITEYLVESN
jgi:hypothetical protein